MTTSTDTPDAPPQSLAEHVAKLAGTLQSGAIANRAGPVADLARLRRCLDATPGADPTVWRIIFGDFPDQPDGQVPNFTENAAYLAICLFAIHQQSKDSQMHRQGASFTLGRSIRRLAQPPGETDPADAVVRRFNAIVTADDFGETLHHLRSLIGLLRANSIPLDYGRLADDLFKWQHTGRRAQVRLRWSRDFSRVPKTPDDSTADPQTTDSDSDN